MNVLKGIPLPKIAKKLAIINVEKEDNECLKRAIVRALNSVNTYSPQRIAPLLLQLRTVRHSEGPPQRGSAIAKVGKRSIIYPVMITDRCQILFTVP